MDVKGAIKARRSVRKFKRKELPDEVLVHLLEMARTAPSGANRQPWEMVVVHDRQRLKGLVPICKEQEFLADHVSTLRLEDFATRDLFAQFFFFLRQPVLDQPQRQIADR